MFSLTVSSVGVHGARGTGPTPWQYTLSLKHKRTIGHYTRKKPLKYTYKLQQTCFCTSFIFCCSIWYCRALVVVLYQLSPLVAARWKPLAPAGDPPLTRRPWRLSTVETLPPWWTSSSGTREHQIFILRTSFIIPMFAMRNFNSFFLIKGTPLVS
jgi:hypothetical protein